VQVAIVDFLSKKYPPLPNSGAAPVSSSPTSPSNCLKFGSSTLWRNFTASQQVCLSSQSSQWHTKLPFYSSSKIPGITGRAELCILPGCTKVIHKIRHQHSAPFGLAAEYASPIEVMMLGFGTVGCPILWCTLTRELHIPTMYVWIVLRLFQAIDAHSTSSLGVFTTSYLSGLAPIIMMFTMRNSLATIQIYSDGGT
jgi:hypothetical protein